MLSSRRYPVICLLLLVVSLAVAYYAELVQGIQPCPLCLLQRYAFIICAVLFLLACLHHPKRGGRIVYGSLQLLFLALGLSLSIRQLYLQSLPPSANQVCLPGMHYLFQTMHWTDALTLVLKGSSECGEVHWRLLGLSMAHWAAGLFALLMLLTLRWLSAGNSKRR